MKVLDYKIEGLKYVLPYLRSNEDIKTVLYAIGDRYNNLQSAIIKILDSLNIREARGFLLDNTGREVGAERDELDFGNYFCINRPHINQSKRFYFTTTKESPLSPLSLEDAEFIQKIYAYIGKNRCSGLWDEIIEIAKIITDADNVYLDNPAPAVLSMDIIGKHIVLTRNTVKYLKSITANGIYLEEIKINGKAQ